MELIDKAKLLEEIKRRILEDYNTGDKEKDAVAQGAIASLKYYIEDILEVKEVNLEEELNEWMKYGPHTDYPWCTIPDAIKITAEHFFELGLKAQKGE